MKSIIVILICVLTLQLNAQPTANEVNKAMSRGINLGNTLEPPTEGGWNNGPVQEYYFDDYKAAGFTCVRVPVRWDNHTSKSAPYKVSEEWMNRVEQIIDWGLERDLYIVMNTHHDDWIKTGYNQQSNRDRFDSIWSQIAVRFQNKSEKLLFEMINEPNGLTLDNVNELNARVLSIIRKTNPTRIVLFSGHRWANSDELIAATVPNDPYLIGYFHSYDPWTFAGEANGTWGTTSDRSALKSKFDQVQNWSEKNNVPVSINEFGAIIQFRNGSEIRINDYNSRMRHYAAYVEEALNHNFSFNAWDDGGDFGIYQRANRNWNDVKDILIHTSNKSATDLKISIKQDSLLQISWTNRNESIDSIFIERRTDNTSFTKIASLAPTANSFDDSGLEIEKNYYYRVVYHYADSLNSPSYPQRGQLAPYIRSPFHGQAIEVPGTVEAEDFDLGGQLLTYKDNDTRNKGNAYRKTEGVDIQSRTDGYQVCYVEQGEWMEYTIDVTEAGTYEVTAWVASIEGGGRMGITFGDGRTTFFDIPSTGSSTKLEGISDTHELEAGEQTIRLRIIYLPEFNIDRIEFAKTTSVNTNNIDPKNISLFSAQAGTVTLNTNQSGEISFYNTMGQLILRETVTQPTNIYSLPSNKLLIYHFTNTKQEIFSGKVLIK
ncbi:MAG: cellulase family glycosylhydrolase [Prolixibacteraceae bacterium]|nr:cellulase family glycosylhydrolase [Prolixibacteraceae bacterium]